ncbi:MAG: hypothetical protein MUP33_08980, partial [Polaromonas sp.]|nr:hypothetical protein [Polaromonas sp.]
RTQAVANHHGKWRRAVQRPRVAQRRQGLQRERLEALSQAERSQQLRRILGQCNLAPVESRLRQRGQRLLRDQPDAQAVARQCARQAPAGRAGARNKDVKVYAVQRSNAGAAVC